MASEDMAGLKTKKDRKTSDASVLEIGGRFSRYGKEKEVTVRETEIKEDKVIEQLKVVFRRLDEAVVPTPEKFYSIALELLEGLTYSSDDVERFSLTLLEFKDEEYFREKAGIFLSALINNGRDNDYTVHTNHLGISLSYLGYKNRKNILIKGDGGYGLGLWMESGSISVEGDVKIHVGWNMKGGTITVKGCARDEVGRGMNDGIIRIEGDAGSSVGNFMDGGEIHLSGKFQSISKDSVGGKIYQHGRLVRPTWKTIPKSFAAQTFVKGTLVRPPLKLILRDFVTVVKDMAERIFQNP
jgi:hypothetical protein